MQAPSPKGYALRMSAFFGAFFFPLGIYIPFFAVWLNSLGVEPKEIGLILTIPMATRVIFTPFMAGIADKIGDRRLTLQIYCVVFAVTFAMITISDNLLWIALVMAVSHIAQSAIIPVSDSLAMAGTRRFDLDYGRMRSWGSLAFMVANLIGGVVLDAFGAANIIWVMVIGNMLHIIFSMTLPSDPRLNDNRNLSKGANLNWAQLKQFAQLGFWIILFAASFVQASHSVLYAFATIFWQKIGISANMTGIFWSVSILAEVTLFFYSKKISGRLSWKSLLIVGACLATLRWLLFPLELPVSGYFLLQILHAGSFACTHLGMMFFLTKMVDDELSGTAQGLFTMLTGLLMAIATFLSGYLYSLLEGDAFYIMAGISLFGLVLFLIAPMFSLGHINADTVPLDRD
ncbi:MFS transporter [Cohaesibacter celericrescens]|uniref:Major facilitator superfamily (MFS) profile domain-containing protein n=1 Tax=Cohaesibacter celericrescens TaxID=2067669 RepID=A0A2N5XWT1_9HYPH|nr:MFS transporter [Cohaesibacter celericrescens]PLW75461.1 hypothetical protein C0081_19140 [Cohaesibacter celericrescens]PLW78868.1 hypothetical protein C0081_01100 [Cohaesibacter celericrescens]